MGVGVKKTKSKLRLGSVVEEVLQTYPCFSSRTDLGSIFISYEPPNTDGVERGLVRGDYIYVLCVRRVE